MSLDVYLEADTPPIAPTGGSGIFIRRDGATVEISREEWDRQSPDRQPVIATAECDADATIYHRNITHNLGKMATTAGIYEHLWRPEEIGITRARELIEPLTDGLARLQTDPCAFSVHNPPNGWGNYDGLVAFVASYLASLQTISRRNRTCIALTIER